MTFHSVTFQQKVTFYLDVYNQPKLKGIYVHEKNDHKLSVYILCDRADIHSIAAHPQWDKVHGSEK